MALHAHYAIHLPSAFHALAHPCFCPLLSTSLLLPTTLLWQASKLNFCLSLLPPSILLIFSSSSSLKLILNISIFPFWFLLLDEKNIIIIIIIIKGRFAPCCTLRSMHLIFQKSFTNHPWPLISYAPESDARFFRQIGSGRSRTAPDTTYNGKQWWLSGNNMAGKVREALHIHRMTRKDGSMNQDRGLHLSKIWLHLPLTKPQGETLGKNHFQWPKLNSIGWT